MTFSEGGGGFFANIEGPVRAIRSYLGANSGYATQRDHFFYPRRHEIVTYCRVHPIPGALDYMDYSVGRPGHALFQSRITPAAASSTECRTTSTPACPSGRWSRGPRER